MIVSSLHPILGKFIPFGANPIWTSYMYHFGLIISNYYANWNKAFSLCLLQYTITLKLKYITLQKCRIPIGITVQYIRLKEKTQAKTDVFTKNYLTCRNFDINSQFKAYVKPRFHTRYLHITSMLSTTVDLCYQKARTHVYEKPKILCLHLVWT